MKRHFFSLIGPPGVGKGTQAEKLSKALNLPHISTGAMLRDEIARQSPLGKKVQSVVDAGELIPDTLILELLFSKLATKSCSAGAILDGVPRTLSQAKMIESRLKDQDTLVALSLEAADRIVLERIAKRGRDDDNQEIAARRLALYKKQTEPLLHYYRIKGSLLCCGGDGSVEKVFGQILLLALKHYTPSSPALYGKKTR